MAGRGTAQQPILRPAPWVQNGGVPASNTQITVTAPEGTSLDPASPPRVVADNGSTTAFAAGAFTASGTQLTLNLGTAAAHSHGSVRVFFKVSPTANPAIIKYIVLNSPKISGRYTPASFTLTALHSVADAIASANGTTVDPIVLNLLSSPHLIIGHAAPWTVKKGGQLTYTIFFANSGDLDATNVHVGMQIPSGTQFVGATQGYVSAPNGATDIATVISTPIKYAERTASQARSTGGASHDIATWTIGTLPAHAGGAVEITVLVNRDFSACAVEDHSSYISADNTAAAAPRLLSTNVRSGDFFHSLWESVGCFFNGIGAAFTKANQPQLADTADGITASSHGIMIAATDGVVLTNGVCVLPLKQGRVLCVASPIVAQGGGNIVAQGGGNIVAQGGHSAVEIDVSRSH